MNLEEESGILYLHGFASSPKSKKAGRLQETAEALGAPYRVPDLNQGGFQHLTVTRAIRQVQAQLFSRTLLIGSSLGGYIATQVAQIDSRVQSLLLLAPAFDPGKQIEQRFGKKLTDHWAEEGVVPIYHYGSNKFEPLNHSFLDDLKNWPGMPVPTVPTQLIFGRNDDTVDVNLIRQFAEEAKLEASHELDDGHSLLETSTIEVIETAFKALWGGMR